MVTRSGWCFTVSKPLETLVREPFANERNLDSLSTVFFHLVDAGSEIDGTHDTVSKLRNENRVNGIQKDDIVTGTTVTDLLMNDTFDGVAENHEDCGGRMKMSAD